MGLKNECGSRESDPLQGPEWPIPLVPHSCHFKCDAAGQGDSMSNSATDLAHGCIRCCGQSLRIGYIPPLSTPERPKRKPRPGFHPHPPVLPGFGLFSVYEHPPTLGAKRDRNWWNTTFSMCFWTILPPALGPFDTPYVPNPPYGRALWDQEIQDQFGTQRAKMGQSHAPRPRDPRPIRRPPDTVPMR